MLGNRFSLAVVIALLLFLVSGHTGMAQMSKP
jgi:hypothetical protein